MRIQNKENTNYLLSTLSEPPGTRHGRLFTAPLSQYKRTYTQISCNQYLVFGNFILYAREPIFHLRNTIKHNFFNLEHKKKQIKIALARLMAWSHSVPRQQQLQGQNFNLSAAYVLVSNQHRHICWANSDLSPNTRFCQVPMPPSQICFKLNS